MQLPQIPTPQQLQADPTAPIPAVGGFVNILIVSFPQSPLLQTGMFVVPQMTTPQSVAASTFLEQLQMATPTSTQLPSPLTTGPPVLSCQLVLRYPVCECPLLFRALLCTRSKKMFSWSSSTWRGTSSLAKINLLQNYTYLHRSKK
jgi:hypothetical protein